MTESSRPGQADNFATTLEALLRRAYACRKLRATKQHEQDGAEVEKVLRASIPSGGPTRVGSVREIY
jgi:hypothetical protein